MDNLHPFCYIYEPQEFVDSMNNAITEALHDWGYDDVNKDPDKLSCTAFFSLEGGKLVFYQSVLDEMKLVFSENLYKYFGVGFNTKRVPSENGFMIAIDKATRTPCLTKDDWRIVHYGNPDMHLKLFKEK